MVKDETYLRYKDSMRTAQWTLLFGYKNQSAKYV